MKRILKNLFKTIEQKNKQQLIVELLTVDSTIEESVTLFEKVKSDFLFKLSQKQDQIKNDLALIEELKSKHKIVVDLYDINVTDFKLVSTEKPTY